MSQLSAALPSHAKELQPLCQIAAPVGNAMVPTAIILDSGSTDGGPSKLATGAMSVPRSAYKRDLTKLVSTVLKYQIPLLISSTGGDGSNAHVDEIVEVIQDILQAFSKKLNILAIYSDVPKSTVLERLDSGEISGCGPVVPPLTKEMVEASPTIVAQMGPEAIFDAMVASPGFDIVIAGRAYDPAPDIAYCAYQSLRGALKDFAALDRNLLGGFTHMGKIIKYGGICATPKSQGAIATIYIDGTFDICPMNPKARCTPLSVAAHTLYEKTRPDILHGPGGWLDLTKTSYQHLEHNVSIRVKGATFTFSTDVEPPHTVKLEGAREVGTASEDGKAVCLFTWIRIFAEETSQLTPSYGTKTLNVQSASPFALKVKDFGISVSPRTLRDIAKAIRSKNAGPFEVTLDVMFEDVRVYHEVKKSGLLCPETISKHFAIRVKDIVWYGFFDQALAFKATLPRTRGGSVICSGGFMEDDVHGSQQYMPLLELKLNEGLIKGLQALTNEVEVLEKSLLRSFEFN